MDIIERLEDSELYVDAIDDAIAEIKRLRRRVEVLETVAKVYYSQIDSWIDGVGHEDEKE